MTERDSFPWPETAARLRALAATTTLTLDAGGRAFVGDGVRFSPPAVVPIDGRAPATYLTAFPDRLGRQMVVLLQAGAAALGLWQDDELSHHKVIKKYVVRGHGRAQPTHLATKGKSRYGSRLRLRNARSLLLDVNERLGDWWKTGPIDRVFYACPVRLWADLFHAAVPPPFTKDAAHKIPMHVHTPDFEELLRVRRWLSRGVVERD